MTGRIARLFPIRAFGFITSGGTEYFFHNSALRGVAFEELAEGQAVAFEVGQGERGPRAEAVRLAED